MFYSLREGVAGLFRAKFSSILAVFVICLSLLVIGVFLIFSDNMKRIIDSIRDRIELEVFVDNSYNDEKIEEIKNKIIAIEGVKTVSYTSKEQAAEFYNKHFGENVFEILEENPLPASFQIVLSKGYQTSQKAKQVVGQLSKLEGVDEVGFRKEILVLLEKYLRIAVIVVFSIGIILVVGSMLLISNTIKLIIMSRIQIIETMKLVGATKGFIRRPFIIEGIIQGVAGSTLAVIFFYLAVKTITIEIPKLIVISREIFFIIFASGIFLGFIGSLFAIRRFLKY